MIGLNCHFYGGMWRSLVAHFVRDEGAAGSNPVIPIVVRSEIICRSSQINVAAAVFWNQFNDAEFSQINVVILMKWS